MATLWRCKFFLAGLLARGVLILVATSWAQAHWFVPFIRDTVLHIPQNPWSTFLSQHGDLLAFPYGPVMYLSYLPGVLIGALFDTLLSSHGLVLIGFGLTTLLFDFFTLMLLRSLFPAEEKRVLQLYWLSPIVLYVGYWYGQTDIVPVFFLLCSLATLRRFRFKLSGAFLGLAVATKLSMLIVAPFFFLYLNQNKRLHWVRWRHFLAFLLPLALLQIPLFLSEAVQAMVLNNREMDKLYFLKFNISGGISIFVVPMVYSLLFFFIFQLRRMNNEILVSCICIGFMILLVLTPASVGWYYWSLPFLVIHILQSGSPLMAWLLAPLTIFFLGVAPFNSSGSEITWLALDLTHPTPVHLPERVYMLWQTGLVTVCLFLLWILFRDGVIKNGYFRVFRRPLMITVAGDSGSGKDTLVLHLAGLFGDASVVSVSGDDYHLWDRFSPMWKVITHLNPRANNLLAFVNDIQSIFRGRRIHCRKYDHDSGRFMRGVVVNDNDVILVSGLHALYTPTLNEMSDVRVFLDMDDDLRRYFKIRRDVAKRGQSREKVLEFLARRVADAERFIKPQRGHADIVFSLRPVNSEELDLLDAKHQNESAMKLKLDVQVRNAIYCEELVRILIGICGLRIDVNLDFEHEVVKLSIEGEVGAEDISMACKMLVSQSDEMLAIYPKWQGGMLGVMQLIVIIHLVSSIYRKK
ncbi:MAG: phosphoribulokinase/uridine kinase [Magnetococcales bacterium]|nr:phosphoribulokinase/uridine kinase [Magnetococcales bacterium]MBF0321427.1 phosphoribulokinase/uridine kinase [Magnetococcales bacterium]